MPASAAGQQPATSTTVRPADKGAKATGPDATAVRMAVSGLSAVSGMRRKAARGVVLVFVSTGRVPAGVPLDGWAHWLRSPNTGRLDPTGETVVRRDRERGGRSA